MKQWKKLTALCLCAVCSCAFLTGCGTNAKRNQNIAEEDLPFGATMREDKTSYAIPIAYDRRFINEEQVAAIANYYSAIQNQDADLYQASTFDYYLDYQKDKVYAVSSPEELVQKLHASIAQNAGEDFQFHMVTFTGVATNQEAGDLHEICTMLGSLYTGETSFSDSLTGAWDFTVEWNINYENDSKFLNVADQHIFLFQTADGYFCVT